MSDWRLNNQIDYLYKARLKKSVFLPTSGNDHEHCEFCWDKFGHNALKLGYCTLDEYRWICPTCFDDFKEQFQWIVINDKHNTD